MTRNLHVVVAQEHDVAWKSHSIIDGRGVPDGHTDICDVGIGRLEAKRNGRLIWLKTLEILAIEHGLEEKVSGLITEDLEVARGVGSGARGRGFTIRHNVAGRVASPEVTIGSTKHGHASLVHIVEHLMDHLAGENLDLGANLAREGEVRYPAVHFHNQVEPPHARHQI